MSTTFSENSRFRAFSVEFTVFLFTFKVIYGIILNTTFHFFARRLIFVSQQLNRTEESYSKLVASQINSMMKGVGK